MPKNSQGFDGFWYRVEIKHYSVADEWGDHAYTSAQEFITKFAVVKETPKGVFLKSVPLGFTTGFVRGKGKVQLACPTIELARADAIARKKCHVAGCLARLRRAEEDLKILERNHAQTALSEQLLPPQ